MQANAQLINDNKGLKAEIAVLTDQIAKQDAQYNQNQQMVQNLEVERKSEAMNARILEQAATAANEDTKRVEMQIGELNAKYELLEKTCNNQTNQILEMTDKEAEMETENRRLQGTIAGLELQVTALKKAAGEERKKNLLKDLSHGKSKQALLAQGHSSQVNIKKGADNQIGSGINMLKAAPGSLFPASG